VANAPNRNDEQSTRRLIRRAFVLSVLFPVVSWFFASWVGLVVGLVAVASWWVLNRPVRTYWAVAVFCVAAAPLALFVQGLPQRSVAGADFVSGHWVANDLVLAAIVLAGLAVLAELLGLDFERRPTPAGPSRFGRWVGEQARRRFQPGEPSRSAPLQDDEESSQGRLDLGDEPGSQMDGLLPTT
jgi:H+/Cl- antiporter ClcA